MRRLRVAPIVEGHGEVESVRILIQRVWTELLGGEFVDVLRPIRQKRQKLVKPDELKKAVGLAEAKLADQPPTDDSALVLVLIDADKDPACTLGPQLLTIAREVDDRQDVSCVLAVVEYETWFVAAAESLGAYLDLKGATALADPEHDRLGKGWVASRFKGVKYSETQDQPAMTRSMNLGMCRARSPSFDKLCREFEKRIIV